MLENCIKLRINSNISPNFQKFIQEISNNEAKSNQYSMMLIYETLSYNHHNNCDIEKSFHFLQKAFQSSKNINFIYFALDIAHLYNIAGIVLSKFGYEPLIEQYFLQSINIRDLINQTQDKDQFYFVSCYYGSYINLGNFYHKAKDYARSKFYYEKALGIFRNSKDLKISGIDNKIELYIEICNLYLYNNNNKSQYCLRNWEEFEDLRKLSEKFIHENLLH